MDVKQQYQQSTLELPRKGMLLSCLNINTLRKHNEIIWLYFHFMIALYLPVGQQLISSREFMTYTCWYCYHKQLNKDNNKRNRLSTTYCFLLLCIPYITSLIYSVLVGGVKNEKHKTHPFSHCILYTIKVKILCYAKKENLFLSSIQFLERMERSLLSDL